MAQFDMDDAQFFKYYEQPPNQISHKRFLLKIDQKIFQFNDDDKINFIIMIINFAKKIIDGNELITVSMKISKNCVFLQLNNQEQKWSSNKSRTFVYEDIKKQFDQILKEMQHSSNQSVFLKQEIKIKIYRRILNKGDTKLCKNFTSSFYDLKKFIGKETKIHKGNINKLLRKFCEEYYFQFFPISYLEKERLEKLDQMISQLSPIKNQKQNDYICIEKSFIDEIKKNILLQSQLQENSSSLKQQSGYQLQSVSSNILNQINWDSFDGQNKQTESETKSQSKLKKFPQKRQGISDYNQTLNQNEQNQQQINKNLKDMQNFQFNMEKYTESSQETKQSNQSENQENNSIQTQIKKPDSIYFERCTNLLTENKENQQKNQQKDLQKNQQKNEQKNEKKNGNKQILGKLVEFQQQNLNIQKNVLLNNQEYYREYTKMLQQQNQQISRQFQGVNEFLQKLNEQIEKMTLNQQQIKENISVDKQINLNQQQQPSIMINQFCFVAKQFRDIYSSLKKIGYFKEILGSSEFQGEKQKEKAEQIYQQLLQILLQKYNKVQKLNQVEKSSIQFIRSDYFKENIIYDLAIHID